jgi:sugar phosphate isomerase/epimerase
VGEGTIDWEGLIIALTKHGFQGHLGIDVGMVDDLERGVRQSVLFLKELCGGLGVPLDT